VHAQREGNRARDPRAREWAAAVNPAGTAGLTVLREGWQPDRGETLGLGQRLDAQRNSPALRCGDTPRPAQTWRHHLHQLRHNAQRHSFRHQIVHAQRRPCSPFRELRVFRVNLINSSA
jgi:hypothetical protein